MLLLLALFVASAVIVHVPAVAGAVNRPAVPIDPHEVDQFTATFAVNCIVPIACTAAVDGVITT